MFMIGDNQRVNFSCQSQTIRPSSKNIDRKFNASILPDSMTHIMEFRQFTRKKDLKRFLVISFILYNAFLLFYSLYFKYP